MYETLKRGDRFEINLTVLYDISIHVKLLYF